jgi:hypothetical protein
MTFYSLFQPPLLVLAVGLLVLDIGTLSETGMTEVEEDRFVCLACQARHFPAVYSSRRALRVHIHKSKNPKCAQEWSKIKVMTRPCDVIADGAGGMGPCPPSQHQPPGGAYTHNILCIYNVYSQYIHCIFLRYTRYIPSIYLVYTEDIQDIYTWYIQCIYWG